jgi:hypothetical protein
MEEASELLDVSKSIFELLRRVDRGRPMMGKIYCHVFCPKKKKKRNCASFVMVIYVKVA